MRQNLHRPSLFILSFLLLLLILVILVNDGNGAQMHHHHHHCGHPHFSHHTAYFGDRFVILAGYVAQMHTQPAEVGRSR